jgi:hypothetical protein
MRAQVSLHPFRGSDFPFRLVKSSSIQMIHARHLHGLISQNLIHEGQGSLKETGGDIHPSVAFEDCSINYELPLPRYTGKYLSPLQLHELGYSNFHRHSNPKHNLCTIFHMFCPFKAVLQCHGEID